MQSSHLTLEELEHVKRNSATATMTATSGSSSSTTSPSPITIAAGSVKASPARSHPVMAAMHDDMEANETENAKPAQASISPESLPGAYASVGPGLASSPRPHEIPHEELISGIQEMPSAPSRSRSVPGAHAGGPGCMTPPRTNLAIASPAVDEPTTTCTDTELVRASEVPEDSEDQASNNEALPTASPWDIEAAQKQQQKREEKTRQYYVLFLLISCCLIVAMIVMGSILGMAQQRNSEPKSELASGSTDPSYHTNSEVPTQSPTSSLDSLLLELPYHTLANLRSIDTPQWKAFDWLSRHQNITDLPDWRKKQLFALATFYYAFEGQQWHDLIQDNWMDDTIHECLWFSSGFGSIFNGEFYHHHNTSIWKVDPCNERGEFESLYLDLDIYSLNPYIPPEIALLTSLTRLSLFMCNIQGSLTISAMPSELFAMTKLTWLSFNLKPDHTSTLPSELGLLTNLETIHLAQTALTGSIPTELGLLTAMKSLHLYQNNLTSSLPTQMGQMSNLEDLSLFENALTGQIPSELFGSNSMSHLSIISLSSNQFYASTIASTIGLLTSLEFLDLSNSFLQGTVPSELGNLERLTSLQLSYNELHGNIPEELGGGGGVSGLESVVAMHLEGNALTGTIPESLLLLPNMELLRLSENALTGTISVDIGMASPSKLSSLWLSNNLLQGRLPSQLALLESLEELYLQNNQLTGSLTELEDLLGNDNTTMDLRLEGNQFSGLVPQALCSLLECDCTQNSDVLTCGGLEEMPTWPGRLPPGVDNNLKNASETGSPSTTTAIMLNLHTDAKPEQNSWIWQKWSNETATWEPLMESGSGKGMDKRMFLYSHFFLLHDNNNGASYQLVLHDQVGDGLSNGGWVTLVATNGMVVLSVPRSRAFSTLTVTIQVVDGDGTLEISTEETECSELLLELGGATACPCLE